MKMPSSHQAYRRRRARSASYWRITCSTASRRRWLSSEARCAGHSASLGEGAGCRGAGVEVTGSPPAAAAGRVAARPSPPRRPRSDPPRGGVWRTADAVRLPAPRGHQTNQVKHNPAPGTPDILCPSPCGGGRECETPLVQTRFCLRFSHAKKARPDAISGSADAETSAQKRPSVVPGREPHRPWCSGVPPGPHGARLGAAPARSADVRRAGRRQPGASPSGSTPRAFSPSSNCGRLIPCWRAMCEAKKEAGSGGPGTTR